MFSKHKQEQLFLFLMFKCYDKKAVITLQALQGCKLLNNFYFITVLKYYLHWRFILILD